MNTLVQELDRPIAGCVLSTIVRHDALFLEQTGETFNIPFNAKVLAFKAVESVIQIKNLDFFVVISSLAIFGRQGLTNYAR